MNRITSLDRQLAKRKGLHVWGQNSGWGLRSQDSDRVSTETFPESRSWQRCGAGPTELGSPGIGHGVTAEAGEGAGRWATKDISERRVQY